MAPEVFVMKNNGATSDDEARAMTMPGCQWINTFIDADTCRRVDMYIYILYVPSIQYRKR